MTPLPALTIAEVARFDSATLVSGYLDGFGGRRPADRESRAYMHGFRAGRSDRTGKVRAWQRVLAREIVAKRGGA